jgi:predicted CopG family antitoxin
MSCEYRQETQVFKTVCTCTYMSKTISLTDEAYNILKSMKLKQESFSDTIKRLAKKGKLSEVLYLYPELREAEEFEEAIRDNREAIDTRL